jgi:hypothetical protein
VLGGPEDEVVTKEDRIPKSGLASIGAPGPISITVDHKLICGLSMKKNTKIQSALKIAENTLQGNHVRLSRIMHMEADLLNCIRNIRASECQVLQSTGQAATICRAADRIACVTIKL